jgi:hypothetical protein
MSQSTLGFTLVPAARNPGNQFAIGFAHDTCKPQLREPLRSTVCPWYLHPSNRMSRVSEGPTKGISKLKTI